MLALLAILTAAPIVQTAIFPEPTPAVVAPCPGDVNRDGSVSIDELIQAINAALGGCP